MHAFGALYGASDFENPLDVRFAEGTRVKRSDELVQQFGGGMWRLGGAQGVESIATLLRLLELPGLDGTPDGVAQNDCIVRRLPVSGIGGVERFLPFVNHRQGDGVVVVSFWAIGMLQGDPKVLVNALGIPTETGDRAEHRMGDGWVYIHRCFGVSLKSAQRTLVRRIHGHQPIHQVVDLGLGCWDVAHISSR